MQGYRFPTDHATALILIVQKHSGGKTSTKTFIFHELKNVFGGNIIVVTDS